MLPKLVVPAIFLAIFFIACVMFCNTDTAESAVPGFFAKVSSGNHSEILEAMGDNTCKCPPHGGWQSYINYESGHDPNLAFLVGKPFQYKIGKTTALDNKIPYVFPWDKPDTAYVDAELTFKPSYRPLFLPLPMAYGLLMSEKSFNEFLKAPNDEAWKGFTERLRPTTRAGFIKTINTLPESMAKKERDSFENLLSPEMLVFLRPSDAGVVTTADGKQLSAPQLESKLPKLVAAKLKLKMVRSGQLKPWLVNKFRFEEATLAQNGSTWKVSFPLSEKTAL